MVGPGRPQADATLLQQLPEPLGSVGVSVEFFYRVEHGGDVFYGGVHLHVVDGVEDEAAVFVEDFATLQDFGADLFGRSEGEGFLGIYAAAPEGQAIAVA